MKIGKLNLYFYPIDFKDIKDKHKSKSNNIRMSGLGYSLATV